MIKSNNILIIIIILIIISLGGTYIIKDFKIIGNLKKDEKTPILNLGTNEKKVSLTFDINWAEEDYLYEILDILDLYNVKGTFFIMGKWVNYREENKIKLEEIAKRGHEIGNHSYVHPDFRKITKERIEEEILKTEEIIEKVTKYKTEIFRFPSGAYNDESIKIVEDLGYIPIQWDVDSVDWRNDGEKIEYERVINKVKEGSIILMHNNGKYTPNNLRKIIENLKEKDYQFLKISEVLLNDNI